MRDTTAALPDGRILAYTDLGLDDGPAAFFFHGAPTSRLDLVPFDRELAELGVRVIAPDRPGYGGSTPMRERRWEAWSTDVVELADALGIDRFVVIGHSSGGPYAVVTAALLGARVLGAAVVAGVTDMGWAPAWEGYPSDECEIMRLGDVDAAVEWCVDRYGANGLGWLEAGGELAAPDRAVLGDPVRGPAMMATFVEAFRQGVVGYAHDMIVQARRWSFDPSAIAAPVRVVYGELDTVVPIAHNHHTASLIPGAELVAHARHGHVSVMNEIPALAAALTSR